MSSYRDPKKRIRRTLTSSDELTYEDFPKIERSFDTMLELIKKMNEGKLQDFEDIMNIQTTITKTRDSIVEFIKWLKENPDRDVKAISFSEFNSTNLTTRLGVVVRHIDWSETPDNLIERLTKGILNTSLGPNATPGTALDIHGIVKVIDDHNFTSLKDSLTLIDSSVNIRPEARGRMLIDQWLLESMKISQTLGQGYRSILFPEFQISSLSREPVKIKYEKDGVIYITYITGSTDYALMSLPARDFTEEHQGFVDSTDLLPVTFISEYETFTFVEAKRKEEELDHHIPQVAAQCFAMCEKGKTEKDGNVEKMRQMPFCLTTGEKWIFGVFDTVTSSKDDMKACWTTSIFQLELNTSYSLSIIRKIMKLLIVWKLQPADLLTKLIVAE